MNTFQAVDPNFKERTRGNFFRQQVMAYLGVEMGEPSPGYSETGRTLVIACAVVSALKHGKETLCATLLQTLMTMKGKSDGHNPGGG